MKDHKNHMDRLSELARQVDEAKASSEETSRIIQRTQRALDEARRRARVFDTAPDDAERRRSPARRRRNG